jgi:hypothetical protein
LLTEKFNRAKKIRLACKHSIYLHIKILFFYSPPVVFYTPFLPFFEHKHKHVCRDWVPGYSAAITQAGKIIVVEEQRTMKTGSLSQL